MYQLLQSEKQHLTIMWAQIAPNEPTADLTPAEASVLQDAWIAIAPHELFNIKATNLERKGAFELAYTIPGFFAPAPDEALAFEESYQRHVDSYIIWK